MKGLNPHNHVFGSDNRCQICHTPAPEPPAFLRRSVGAGDGNTYVVDTAWYKARIADLERQLANEKAQCAALIHDIDRHIAIASGEADARAKAEARCAKMRKTLEWFSDPRNYEDTEQYVAYLRANIVWSTGISVALAALAEGGEHG